MFTGDSLPIEGNEPFIQTGVGRSVRSGSYVYLSDTNPTKVMVIGVGFIWQLMTFQMFL